MDEQLRRLEMAAAQGDNYAKRLWAIWRYRAGLIDRSRLYIVFESLNHLEEGEGCINGYPVVWDQAKGRWEFQTITDETSYSIESLMWDVCQGGKSMHLVEADPCEVDDDYSFDNDHGIQNWLVLAELKPRDVYHPHGYNKEDIEECETPTYNIKEITILYKFAGLPPQIGTIESTYDAIRELVGGDIEVHNIKDDTFMIVREVDAPGLIAPLGLEPNFVWSFGQQLSPELLARVSNVPVIMGPSGEPMTAEELLRPRPQIIHGDVVFVKMKYPNADELDFSQMPWPWNEIFQENLENGEGLPEGEGFYSLEASDIYHLESILGRGVQLLRKMRREPIPEILPVEATHFTMQDQTVGSRGASIYTLDECENCGTPAMGPNSVGVDATRGELFFYGLQELPTEPPELGYDEDLEMATCGC